MKTKAYLFSPLIILLVFFSANSLAKTAQSIKPASLMLKGHIDIVVSSCSAAGLTLSSNVLPAQVIKVRPGSPAYYKNIEAKDEILDAQILGDKLYVIFSRNGQKYSAELNTVPVNRIAVASGINGGNDLVKNASEKSQPINTAAFNLSDADVAVPDNSYRHWFKISQPMLATSIEKFNKEAILDVEGSADETGQILAAFGMPYLKISTDQLIDYPFDGVHVIILNCPGDAPSASYPRLRSFVEKGGYLVTSDWALDHYLQNAFPELIRWNSSVNKKYKYTAAVVNADPVFLNGAVTHAMWFLNANAHLVEIIDPSKAEVLVASKELSEEDPKHGGSVAIVFTVGRGKILHIVGHVGIKINNKLPDSAPVIGISLRQAIVANFVASALTSGK